MFSVSKFPYLITVVIALLYVAYGFEVSTKQLIVYYCCFLLILLFMKIFRKISNIKKVKKIEENIKDFLTSNNYIFSHKNKWRLFYNSNICIYLNGIENAENLLAIIPFRGQESECNIKNIIEEKAKNHFKPVNQILKEASFEDIKKELIEHCEFSVFLGGRDIPGIPKGYDHCKNIDYDCEDCPYILDVYEKLLKIYHKLLDIPSFDNGKIIGQEEQTLKGLSPEEIVSARYKDPTYIFSGQCELTDFVLNLLLYFYKFDKEASFTK